MIVRLISVQVPKFWDVIKYALQQTEAITEVPTKFNELFAALLNDKAQCFLKYSDGPGGEIQGVMVTELHEDRFTKERSVKIRCLYAYKVLPRGEWEEDFKLIRGLAISEKCTRVFFDSKNPRVLQVAREVGFKEACTTMEILIGG